MPKNPSVEIRTVNQETHAVKLTGIGGEEKAELFKRTEAVTQVRNLGAPKFVVSPSVDSERARKAVYLNTDALDIKGSSWNFARAINSRGFKPRDVDQIRIPHSPRATIVADRVSCDSADDPVSYTFSLDCSDRLPDTGTLPAWFLCHLFRIIGSPEEGFMLESVMSQYRSEPSPHAYMFNGMGKSVRVTTAELTAQPLTEEAVNALKAKSKEVAHSTVNAAYLLLVQCVARVGKGTAKCLKQMAHPTEENAINIAARLQEPYGVMNYCPKPVVLSETQMGSVSYPGEIFPNPRYCRRTTMGGGSAQGASAQVLTEEPPESAGDAPTGYANHSARQGTLNAKIFKVPPCSQPVGDVQAFIVSPTVGGDNETPGRRVQELERYYSSLFLPESAAVSAVAAGGGEAVSGAGAAAGGGEAVSGAGAAAGGGESMSGAGAAAGGEKSASGVVGESTSDQSLLERSLAKVKETLPGAALETEILRTYFLSQLFKMKPRPAYLKTYGDMFALHAAYLSVVETIENKKIPHKDKSARQSKLEKAYYKCMGVSKEDNQERVRKIASIIFPNTWPERAHESKQGLFISALGFLAQIYHVEVQDVGKEVFNSLCEKARVSRELFNDVKVRVGYPILRRSRNKGMTWFKLSFSEDDSASENDATTKVKAIIQLCQYLSTIGTALHTLNFILPDCAKTKWCDAEEIGKRVVTVPDIRYMRLPEITLNLWPFLIKIIPDMLKIAADMPDCNQMFEKHRKMLINMSESTSFCAIM